MTHTPAQRSKRTQAWKRVRYAARNPKTRKAIGVFIRRGIAEACAPLHTRPNWEAGRARVGEAVLELMASLDAERPRAIQVVGSTIDIEGGRLTTTVLVPAWMVAKGTLPQETP